MAATFNRREILKKAHFMARWREGNGQTYAERLAVALRAAWNEVKRLHEAVAKREALRLEWATADRREWVPPAKVYSKANPQGVPFIPPASSLSLRRPRNLSAWGE